MIEPFGCLNLTPTHSQKLLVERLYNVFRKVVKA